MDLAKRLRNNYRNPFPGSHEIGRAARNWQGIESASRIGSSTAGKVNTAKPSPAKGSKKQRLSVGYVLSLVSWLIAVRSPIISYSLGFA